MSIANTHLNEYVQRVYNAARDKGFADIHIQEMPDSTKTAREAATALGCTVSQIAKSLVFQGSRTKKLYLVVASGSNRVEPIYLEQEISEVAKLADPTVVQTETGFAVGGVPPVGHTHELQTFIDKDLMVFETIWAAAGTPHAVFQLTPDMLAHLTGGTMIQIHG
jgi:prolyl-tRNA editing enzyme YbaK/EbsC (Cys-tRNA(Pro) deacylase)